MLINFADSAFALGRSAAAESHRYLKQIKQRNVEKVYHEENVMLCELKKRNSFLGFDFLGTTRERDHLSEEDGERRDLRVQRAHELRDEGLTVRQIASELNISVGTVSNYLKE